MRVCDGSNDSRVSAMRNRLVVGLLSVPGGSIDRMFGGPFHDYFEPPDTPRSRDGYERSASLFELRRRQRGEQQDWAVDTRAAVGAEVAAGSTGGARHRKPASWTLRIRLVGCFPTNQVI